MLFFFLFFFSNSLLAIPVLRDSFSCCMHLQHSYQNHVEPNGGSQRPLLCPERAAQTELISCFTVNKMVFQEKCQRKLYFYECYKKMFKKTDVLILFLKYHVQFNVCIQIKMYCTCVSMRKYTNGYECCLFYHFAFFW